MRNFNPFINFRLGRGVKGLVKACHKSELRIDYNVPAVRGKEEKEFVFISFDIFKMERETTVPHLCKQQH